MPDSPSTPVGRAVFLSYAHEDTAVALRVAEELRANGVEVWFDRSELRGGDTWDAKIKKQIRDCALFVPVISANTQARLEGYFRLEWKLAEDRSHLMARGRPFIVPVAADATSERDAQVPDAFLAVQWTRLAGGDAAALAERIQSLLGGDTATSGAPERFSATAAAPTTHIAVARAPDSASRRTPWVWPAVVVGAAAMVAAAIFLRPRPLRADAAAPQPEAATPRPANVRFIPPRPVLVGPESDDWPVLSPDGKRLAFVRLANGFLHIFALNADGTGEPQQITEGEFDHIQPAWSPDSGTMAYARARKEGNKLKPSDVYGGYQTPRDTDIWTCNLAKGAHELLIASANAPKFNARGEMVFVSESSGHPRIWVCDRLGNQRRPVTEDPDVIAHLEPAWSPDGTRIVFRRQLEKTTAKLAVLDLATRAVTNLTPEFSLSDPVWSPDGKYIYFTANLSSGFNLWRLPVTKDGAAGGLVEPVTFGPGRDVHASFSRDGQRLLFSILSWNSDVWALPMDAAAGQPAGEPFALIVSTREDTRGAWSADGRKIAFTSDRNGDMNLFVCDFEAGKRAVSPPVQVTFGPGGHYQASWNPNGRQLAYFSRQSGNEDIWLVDLDERSRAVGAPRQITRDPGADNNPMFSPDGQHLAFMSSRTGSMLLYVMNPDGTQQRALMSQPVSGHYVRWRDTNSLLAASRGMWIVYLDGREPEKILPTGGSHMSFSPDHRLVADTDHTFLLMTRLGSDATVRQKIFRFPETNAGMDYTVWSPDGRFILFDRSNPQGGDVYELRGPE